ncbi:UNVERIFIED_CONTAM: Retrovirus-related Pol polyprotein from transposon TNT 1-94 [Sesamum calycinum]|uniref:Retrovirus-related Pol polyprotein from transposon TNT 1-94 n=1 Tax=Sesamum calycinum TaxID=2727403 RepID=A0AAW2M9M0_9LAMI
MSLTERARCLRLNAGLPKSLWAEAVSMACYLINRSPQASLGGKVAEEVRTGNPVDFDHLQIFGCSAYVHVLSVKIETSPIQAVHFFGLQERCQRLQVLGSGCKENELEPHPVATENHGISHPTFGDPVALESGGSSHPTSGGSKAGVFAHASEKRFSASGSKKPLLKCLRYQPLLLKRLKKALLGQKTKDRQRRTNVKPPTRLGYEDIVSFALLVSGDELTTFHGAITSQKKKEWIGAMAAEMESLQKYHTWELVQLPEGKKTIRCKWLHRKKPTVSKKEGGKFKARLVAKGYSQQKEIDYDEIFSPVVRHTSIRAELALVTSWDLHLEHMVIKTTFFMVIWRNRFTWSSQMGSLNLNMSIWFIDYKRCEYDCCVYVKNLDDGSSIFLLLYIDDMLIAAKNMHDVLALKALLSQEFDIKDLGCCLMYAMVCTRLDLTHVVSQVCKYMSKLGRHHWEAVKWIFKYLKGTVGHGVVFGSKQNDPLVIGYVDSDYANDLDDRRSTTRYVITLEAEYMAVAEATKQALWLNGLAKELGVEQGGVQLHCDSQSAIYLAINQLCHARTKHIDVRYHKITELICIWRDYIAEGSYK